MHHREVDARIADATPEQLARSQRLIKRTPSLRVHKGALLKKIEELIVGGVVAAWATRQEVLRARLLAVVFVGSLDVVMTSWIDDGAKGRPTAELDIVEALLRRAFPVATTPIRSRRQR